MWKSANVKELEQRIERLETAAQALLICEALGQETVSALIRNIRIGLGPEADALVARQAECKELNRKGMKALLRPPDGPPRMPDPFDSFYVGMPPDVSPRE